MTRKQRRLVLIGSSLGVLALAAVLVLSALKDSIVFFNSPTDVVEKKVQPGSRIRLGGLVKDGAWLRDGQDNTFTVTDTGTDIVAHYRGILPDLFREGQGIVADGTYRKDGVFLASRVLAKHDETYMPKALADSLKEQGEYRGKGYTPDAAKARTSGPI